MKPSTVFIELDEDRVKSLMVGPHLADTCPQGFKQHPVFLVVLCAQLRHTPELTKTPPSAVGMALFTVLPSAEDPSAGPFQTALTPPRHRPRGTRISLIRSLLKSSKHSGAGAFRVKTLSQRLLCRSDIFLAFSPARSTGLLSRTVHPLARTVCASAFSSTAV